MSSSGRRRGSGKTSENPAPTAGPAPGRAAPPKPAAATGAAPAAAGGGERDPHGGWGSPSRFGHFAKYTKPKIGPTFQCAVTKFVPPEAREGAAAGEDGDESGSGSGSATGYSTGYGTRGSSGGRGGRRGRAGRGGRGRGGRGGRGGRPGRGSEAALSKVEQSIANGEKSAVEIANAAAEELQGNFASSLASIPRGGICIHRPLSRMVHDAKAEPAAGAPLSSSEIDAGSAALKKPAMDEQEDFLTYARNLFLQTPRPQSVTNIDDIWDEATAQKYKVEARMVAGKKGRGRGKRKATAMESFGADEDGSVTGSAPATPVKSSMDVDTGRDEGKPPARPEGQGSNDQTGGTKRERQEVATAEPPPSLPLCGLEDDERALSYLQASYHGDVDKAKLSIVVGSDRGYGVQRRRQMKKKRRETHGACPDATTFASESWRWRVHHARPTMVGDYRSSGDPTYTYFDDSPMEIDGLLDGSRPWRLLQRFGEDDDEGELEGQGRRQVSSARPRSFSITWSPEEIEKAQGIWRSIFSYTEDVLEKMAEAGRSNDAKAPLSDLLELVGKAHALPTPEETFGRRDPSGRQMSMDMNSIIDAIERGRDCAAKILLCLRDDGEGIELDELRRTMDEIESSCPVGLAELETVKRQVHEAALWEEKLESNVDHVTADSDAASDTVEEALTEKKLTLDKVERLVSKGKNLTLRPRSLVLLQDRVAKAHVLRRRIAVWNEARSGENPQNLKFVAALIKEANKVDLAFPELFTLTGVHKKAEEWMDRAGIAVRTTISYEELEELVSIGEGLPLNVSDVLEKLQNRLKQAMEWTARMEEIVPRSDDYLAWLRRFRQALDDSDANARLLSLLSEGSRIPVTMECSKLLQIEVDARHWSSKARPWIPPSMFDDTSGASMAPQRRGKVDDVEEHLDRASTLRDRLWFDDDKKSEWVLEGESQLAQMIEMAQTWFDKYDDILSYDSRRKGKLCLPMSKLHAIVDEVNRIPLNLGNPSTKMNRIFSTADEWMKQYFTLIQRCGIDCDYTPSDVEPVSEEEMGKPLKIEELSSAVDDADSELSMDLEVVVKLREVVEKAQVWIDRVDAIAPRKDAVAPKKDSRKKSKQQETHSMEEISELLEESSALIVDISDEMERLKLEQSATMSWRLQAQQSLKEITAAFVHFRKERADVCSSTAAEVESNNPAPAPTTSVPNPAGADDTASGSMTTRNINSRRRVMSTGSSGTETPAYLESGGKDLFPLVQSFIKNVKLMNILTLEGSVADELGEVLTWFTRIFKLTNDPLELYDRKNFSKLDKSIDSGQKLITFDGFVVEEIPEDKTLIESLRQSWADAVKDDVDRLLEWQSKRDMFVKWCEKADAIISSSDKKVSLEALKELEEESASFPSSSEIVLRVRKRAKDSFGWVSSIAEILRKGQKIPIEEAKEMTDAGDKLNISCPEYKELRAALRATRGWLLRVKKCGAGDQGQVAANLVTDLINEHSTFLVTATEEVSNLKQVMCGYCVCRNPYEGFMIGCDGCEEWYHGPCVGITQEQAEKFDKYVCVRCSTLRVYKDNAATVAGILRKWTSAKDLAKARSGDSQRYGRKVRSAERDIVKGKAELEKYERELSNILGLPSNAPPQPNGQAVAPSADPSSSQDAKPSASAIAADGKNAKSEKALRDKIGKTHTTIGNCEKRMEGYKVELVERKSLESREDALALNIKKWCNMVKKEVFSPLTKEVAELSRPRSDGSTSAPMDKARTYAETLGIVKLPDIDSVLNSFKVFSWCLHALGVLMRKPRVDEVRSLLTHSDSGYFKIPEAKCVRMLRSMSSRAQIWQSKVKKALVPVPGEKRPYDVAVLKELLLGAKQIPLIMPEEMRLWSTIEDGGNRHCICGGPSDGSFMLGCDNCDRWFHGSCMKIDKETGDALSKWVCPPCSKKSIHAVVAKNEAKMIVEGDSKLPAQESASQHVAPPVGQPHHDISPHAPNPLLLWPPFGLRRGNGAVEVLGKVGDSDNEDFEARTLSPLAKAKLAAKSAASARPQNNASQQTAAATFAAQAAARVPLCQPVAKVAPIPVARPYPQPNIARAASTASSTSSTASSVSRPAVCLPVGAARANPNTHPQSVRSFTQALAARTGAQPPQGNPFARSSFSRPIHPSPTKPGQSALPPQSTAVSNLANGSMATSAPAQPMPNHINTTPALNGNNLSVAVANMDALVVGESVGLQGVAAAAAPTAPLPAASAAHMTVPNQAPIPSAGSQQYTSTMGQQASKAP